MARAEFNKQGKLKSSRGTHPTRNASSKRPYFCISVHVGRAIQWVSPSSQGLKQLEMLLPSSDFLLVVFAYVSPIVVSIFIDVIASLCALSAHVNVVLHHCKVDSTHMAISQCIQSASELSSPQLQSPPSSAQKEAVPKMPFQGSLYSARGIRMQHVRAVRSDSSGDKSSCSSVMTFNVRNANKNGG